MKITSLDGIATQVQDVTIIWYAFSAAVFARKLSNFHGLLHLLRCISEQNKAIFATIRKHLGLLYVTWQNCIHTIVEKYCPHRNTQHSDC